MDLFEKSPQTEPRPPLADRMRPKTFKEFLGQSHLVGKGKLIDAISLSDHPPSLILWGPPGSGKTTMALMIARTTRCHFAFFSAVLSGIKEVRQVVEEAKLRKREKGQRTILFVDEIHRFNRSQQDAFLPHVENGTFILFGSTTENPSFEINAPLLSRCSVLTLKPLATSEIALILESALSDPDRGLGRMNVQFTSQLLEQIANWSEGDARRALNVLETAVSLCKENQGKRFLTEKEVKEAAQDRPLLFDRDREEHYNIVSAFIKSMRGSDPDAAVYWLARMLEAGEDPLFIARRMVIFASEDIGNADPRALPLAVAAMQAFHAVGLPEGWIPLSQAATFLASAPKSNASYQAYRKAAQRLREKGSLAVPLHLRNATTRLMKEQGYGKDYQYPHDFPGHYVSEDYLPPELRKERYYHPTENGYEKEISERLERWRKDFGKGRETGEKI